MRALVFHGPGSIAVEERPDPVPSQGEVLLRVLATGICGSDVHGYTGENGRRHPGQVMGHETVGTVEAGDGATLAGAGLAIGETVTVNPVLGCGDCVACAEGEEQACPRRRVIGVDPGIVSAFADLLVAPARNVVPLPQGMPSEHGALVEPLSVGYHAARRGRCTERDRVLVLGGGPIGQACVLAATRLGARGVVVSEPNPARAKLVRGLGATVLDPRDGDLASAAADALGGPATLVLDAVGSTPSLADAFAASARGARVVLVGMNQPEVTLPAYAISTAERELIGAFCYNREDFASTARWAATVPDALESLVDGSVGWRGAPGAFADLASGTSSASKILVRPDQEEQQ
ncbi:zinc-dependent alcohol dehydrogenase [Prauserella flavalba]|uniref:Zinc-binding alcohol dehydrogenase n=1 Tax=Prauserella flavalba TaxID=1477506 RepID=A0A318LJZ7_9PSEU|nr:alcohol dehydrogenase catalytic domain-containing protein [Prauserella flavalba]PXY24015.1 zinc-binding alcohol dehydrogenase [Prauserella flavalba]